MEPEVADSGDDIVVTDQSLFDQAVSDTPPVQESVQEEPAAETAEVKAERERDEKGRFAPKTEAKTEAKVAPQDPLIPLVEAPQLKPEDHRVPLHELIAERKIRQEAHAELAQARQRLQQYDNWYRQQQKQKQAPQEEVNIFEAPDEYLQQRVIQPLMQRMEQKVLQNTDKMSRRFANHQYGEKVVNDALNDLDQIRQSPQGDFIYRQVMADGHPYGALVEWHKGVQQQREIGPDPKAWHEKQLDTLMDDPEFQAKVMERARTKAQQPKTSGRPPTVSLPPSLSSIPAAAGRQEDAGDLSDASLYRHAIK